MICSNILVYILELVTPKLIPGSLITSIPGLFMAKVNDLLVAHEWWRLITPSFLVTQTPHILYTCGLKGPKTPHISCFTLMQLLETFTCVFGDENSSYLIIVRSFNRDPGVVLRDTHSYRSDVFIFNRTHHLATCIKAWSRRGRGRECDPKNLHERGLSANSGRVWNHTCNVNLFKFDEIIWTTHDVNCG